MLLIRSETPADYDKIYALIRTAFETAKVKDGDEQNFAVNLRKREGYIPELALVAEAHGTLIGHIMLTETTVDDAKAGILLLAPLSVLIEHRSQGIGAALIEDALKRAASLGYKAVFLVGDPAYYGRFGFKPAHRYGFSGNVAFPPELIDCFMVRELVSDSLSTLPSGVIRLI